MWQSAELWCLPVSTMSRWYFAARVGSSRRAWLALMNRASRSRASPRLVGPPWRPETPEASREGTRPLKRASCGQGLEPAGVAESAQDDRTGDRADAGGGGDDPVGVAFADQHGDAFVDLLDLLGERQRQPGFDGDVLGEVGKGEVVGPQVEAGRAAARISSARALPERAAGVPVEEPGEPGSAEPTHGVWVGITGGQEPQWGLVAQVGVERGVPVRTEDLQQRIEPGQAGGATLDQGGVQLGGPRSGSPGPRPRSGCSPSGCSIGSRARSTESSRSLLVCLA